MARNIIVAAVIMEKGGVGKTTVAFNRAVAALHNGRNATVIDIDPQATASNWTDRRAGEKPWVVPTLTARLAHAIEQAKGQGVDFIVVDTPPHSGSDAARRGDVVLVPVEPHLFTLETLPKLADVLKLAGNPPTLLVISKAATQGTEASSAADHIKAQGFAVCPAVLHLRAAHRHATNVGKVANEFEPGRKAAQEVLQVYTQICRFFVEKPPCQSQTRSPKGLNSNRSEPMARRTAGPGHSRPRLRRPCRHPAPGACLSAPTSHLKSNRPQEHSR